MLPKQEYNLKLYMENKTEEGEDKKVITINLGYIFGLIMIYSASSIWSEYKFNDSFHYVKYQSIFFLIGLFIMIMISLCREGLHRDPNFRRRRELFSAICCMTIVHLQ